MGFPLFQLLLFSSLVMSASRSTSCSFIKRLIEDISNVDTPKKLSLCRQPSKGACAFDAVSVLRAMEENSKYYDLKKAKVLYITNLDKWVYHVVIEYDGLIIDAIDQVDSLGRVVPETASVYFARHTYGPTSQVGVISSVEYLDGLTSRHPHYYWGRINEYGGQTLDKFLGPSVPDTANIRNK